MDKQANPKPAAADPGKQAEARHLAEEAVEELQQGHKDEAAFVLNEARALDKGVVEQVLKDKQAKP